VTAACARLRLAARSPPQELDALFHDDLLKDNEMATEKGALIEILAWLQTQQLCFSGLDTIPVMALNVAWKKSRAEAATSTPAHIYKKEVTHMEMFVLSLFIITLAILSVRG